MGSLPVTHSETRTAHPPRPLPMLAEHQHAHSVHVQVTFILINGEFHETQQFTTVTLSSCCRICPPCLTSSSPPPPPCVCMFCVSVPCHAHHLDGVHCLRPSSSCSQCHCSPGTAWQCGMKPAVCSHERAEIAYNSVLCTVS